MKPYEIRHFVTSGGVDLFLEWFARIRDPVAKVQILKRVNRMEQGNFGDHKRSQDGDIRQAKRVWKEWRQGDEK